MNQIKKDLELITMSFLAKKEFLSIGLVILSMEYKCDQKLPMNAMAGWESKSNIIHFSDEFKKLSLDMKQFIIAHEILHCVLMHDIRGKNKNQLVWNMAGDYMINALLIHLFKISNYNYHINHGGLYDKKYEGWLEEEIYKDLMKNVKSTSTEYSYVKSESGMDGWINNKNQTILNSTKPLKTKNKKSNNTRILNNYTFKQHMTELSKGNISNALKKILNKIINAKIDWTEILTKSIRSILKKSIELSWGKPRTSWLANAGTIPYLPSNDVDEEFGTAIISIDESGSMSEQEVSKAISIVLQAKNYYKDILVIRHDSGEPTCNLYQSQDININNINYRQHNGGTSHKKVFEKINQFRKHNEVSIYIGISDLESDIKENIYMLQKLPKIWLTPRHYEISGIGQIIHVR